MKYLSILSLFILLFVSCGNDDDLRGGFIPIECMNGQLVNGNCVCDEGYEGSICQTESIPAKMIVSKIVVREFPLADTSGVTWDLDSGPDLFVEIFFGTELIYTHPSNYEDAEAGNTYDFIIENSLVNFENVNEVYTVNLFDFDEGMEAPSDWMKGSNFIPYRPGDGFPNKVTIDAGIGFVFDIFYEYQFN